VIWASAWAFSLLIVLLAVAALFFVFLRRMRPRMKFSRVSTATRAPKTVRQRLADLPRVLQVLGLAIAIVALARPQQADEKIHKNVEGIDIMIALDVSDSMLIEDMEPENRLESAKDTIRQFIEGRTSDRIGLIVFSGESFTRVPLTLDYALLKKSLSEVETSRNIKMGTALGVALANAAARLKDSTAKSRVIVFLTDGENNSGTIDPLTALNIAKGYKIRVYTIGVGRDGQTQLPIYSVDQFGRKTKRYQPFYSKVNEDLLTQIAGDTGGKYYRAETTSNLGAVFDEINSLETTKIDVNKFVKYTELFPPYVLMAMLFYLLGMVLEQSVFRRVP
jgi:Ca-activated chloride channel family protein